MKTILHPDYWVEIPAGEFLAGLSAAQHEKVASRLNAQFGWEYYPKWLGYRKVTGRSVFDSQPIRLERFYIARFPITSVQLSLFLDKGIPATELPGALEEPEIVKLEWGENARRDVARIVSPQAEALCKELGARLPSDLEWEKAARGTDGRLYPWGDEWDLDAGFFYHRPQVRNHEFTVDAFPKGLSPYGVWNMVGSLPQMVGNFPFANERGCHSSRLPHEIEMAWLDNIIPFAFKYNYKLFVSLRPVLDQWPVQQWRGWDRSNKV